MHHTVDVCAQLYVALFHHQLQEKWFHFTGTFYFHMHKCTPRRGNLTMQEAYTNNNCQQDNTYVHSILYERLSDTAGGSLFKERQAVLSSAISGLSRLSHLKYLHTHMHAGPEAQPEVTDPTHKHKETVIVQSQNVPTIFQVRGRWRLSIFM